MSTADSRDVPSDREKDREDPEWHEARKREMTEKGKFMKFELYTNSFRSLKRTSTYIKQLVSDKSPIDSIREKYTKWMNELETFFRLYSEIQPQLLLEERDSFDIHHDEKEVFISNFKREMEMFFIAHDKERNVKSDTDKESRKSHRSSHTAVTMLSTKRIKEEQRVMELSAIKKSMKKKREIEMAKLALKFQEEELNIETDLAISTAKTELFRKLEVESEGGSVFSNPISQGKHSTHAKSNELKSSSAAGHLNPDANSFIPQTRATSPHIDQYKGPNMSVVSLNDDNVTVMQSVVQHLRKPAPEIRKFSGDPMEYNRFIRQFHAKVVLNTDNDDERMNYLEQLTVGEANRVVAGFSHLPGERAYNAAMERLKERYGDNEVIVTSFIKKALEWPSVKDAKALDDFTLFLIECENAAESIGNNSVMDYSENIKQLVVKLPVYLHDRWRNVVLQAKENKRTIKFSDFVNFVKREAKKSNDPTYGAVQLSVTKYRHGFRSSGNPTGPLKGSPVTFTDVQNSSEEQHVSASIVTKTLEVEVKCTFCTGAHKLEDCKAFIQKSLQDKYKHLREKGLCYGCLRKGHMTKKCRARMTCAVCGRRHPTLLHDDSRMRPTDGKQNKGETETPACATVSVNLDETGAGIIDLVNSADVSCAMAIVPVCIKHKNSSNSIVTYAFFDSGSSVSFCTEKVMRELSLSGKRKKITLRTVGSPYEMSTVALDDLQVCDLSMKGVVNLPRVYTKEEMPVSKVHIPRQEEIKKWHHLSEVEIPDVDAEIGLMIGNNVPDAYAPLEVLTGPSGSPHATRTRLGWIAWNILRNREAHEVNRVTIESFVESDKRLEEMVKKSINMDFPERVIDDKREHSVEDKNFLAQVRNSITLIDDHYSVALPFRNPSLKLPNNFPQAMQRLRGLEKKLRRDERFKSDYTDFMMKLFEKGYAESVPNDQLDTEGRVWYIPHHGVYHQKKPGKIRVVFDCSASYMGVSLNGQLLQGPDMTNNLLGVLLRFREEEVAVQGDIESMFHQVSVPKEDRDFLRFLWWENGNLDSEPKIFRMKVHIFGATSSPSCCNFALKHLAEEQREDFEQSIVQSVQRRMYVDDCLASLGSVAEAKSFVEDISSLCKKGGFRLTKWVSNSVEVIESIPEDDRAKNAKDWVLGGKSATERALGVHWSVEEDQLGFQIEMKAQPATRRGILSVVSSVYDPLGIASPFIMSAKALLQSLCRLKLGWDDQIGEKQLKCWDNWISQTKELKDLKTDRCFKPRNFGEVTSYQIHCFSDASEVGIGVVIYLRMENRNGAVHCSFVLGKSRVAPLKTVTIPRMELTAATASVRLCKMVIEELDLKVDRIFYWTDSTSVLKYIANTNVRFHTFVANRLAVIHEATEVNQWHYVSTKDNPADCASRGVTNMDKFLNHTIWLRGPEYLSKGEEEWPKKIQKERNDTDEERDPEVKREVVASVSKEETSIKGIDCLIDHFSDWNRMKKATAWLLHGIDNLRKRVKDTKRKREELKRSGLSEENIEEQVKDERRRRLLSKGGHRLLTYDVLSRAEKVLVKHVQRRTFGDDLYDLHAKKGVKRSSRLAKLDPVLHDGILRVGGRLRRSDISYEAKHPMILPKTSSVSRLIVQDAHKRIGHLGKNATLASIRERFWILGAPELVKSVTSKCTVCKRYQGSLMKQKLADLPKERLCTDKPPFSHVGMDYFGPFELKRGRSLVKRYGVIFTCLITRAVHLEVAATLDTDSCINAIRRFIARRGKPNLIRSDNGTNLVGSEREMREAIEKWNTERIQNNMLQKSIQWEFNPPAASHFGGVWERLIRSVRKVLYSVMHEQVIHLDDEGLYTLFCEVEAILNNRPITEASNSANDLDVLTPNHILLLRPGESFPPGTFLRTDRYVRRRWRQIQYLADVFWTRWTKEYLPLLQSRQKWLKEECNAKVGDLVLVADNSSRNTWNLGRIVEVQKDSNNLVRVAKVKTASTTLTRPIAKLCLVLESDLEKSS